MTPVRALRRPLLALLLALLLAPPLMVVAGPTPPPSRPRLIVVGWDGADWDLLDPLMKEGALPSLARLVGRGRTWSLEAYEPMASPLLWTTIATGRGPLEHGVADFQELDPKTKARLPISGRGRKVPAIWNVASARGVSVGVVGWWATWPAERVKGFLVSDRAAPVLFDAGQLSRSPGVAWPEGLAEGVRIVLGRESSPSYEDVARGMDVSRAELDQAVKAGKDLGHPITGYRKILGYTRSLARIALDLYDRDRPELLMVYFQGTDEIGHILGRFHPPRMADVPEADFRRYSRSVRTLYAEADRILGELASRAERDGATLVLVSDHGFKWKEDRPRTYSGAQFDTAFHWHRPTGILAAAGPAVPPGRARGKASIFDVTPTLCRLLGLPADPAFEGRALDGLSGAALPRGVPALAWAGNVPVERMVVSASAEDRKAAEEYTKKLISLGYLTGADAAAVDARPPDRAGTETSGHFQNLGTYLRGRGKARESLEWYRKALDVNPRSAAAWLNLSVSLEVLERFPEADEATIAAIRSGHHDPPAAVDRRLSSYAKRASASDPKALAARAGFLRKVTEALPDDVRYRSALGKALFEARDCAGSLEVFQRLTARSPTDFESWNLVALSSLCLGRPVEARAAFERSLAIKPDQPVVREALRDLSRELPGARR